MQAFHRTGLAPNRDAIDAELVALSERNGLIIDEVLGHLTRVQARGALADFAGADAHAAAVDRLAERHELPLAAIFTRWYRALRLAAIGDRPVAEVEAAYQDAAARLDGSGMPGLEHGLPSLALLCPRVRDRRPVTGDEEADWGPYAPWARPLVLVAHDRRDEATAALRRLPDPPRDLLLEALWRLAAHAAIAVGDGDTIEHAHATLTPAAPELAGAGSGLLTLRPTASLDDLTAALKRTR